MRVSEQGSPGFWQVQDAILFAAWSGSHGGDHRNRLAVVGEECGRALRGGSGERRQARLASRMPTDFMNIPPADKSKVGGPRCADRDYIDIDRNEKPEPCGHIRLRHEDAARM